MFIMNSRLPKTMMLNFFKGNSLLLRKLKKKIDAFIFFCLCAGCIREV